MMLAKFNEQDFFSRKKITNSVNMCNVFFPSSRYRTSSVCFKLNGKFTQINVIGARVNASIKIRIGETACVRSCFHLFHEKKVKQNEIDEFLSKNTSWYAAILNVLVRTM